MNNSGIKGIKLVTGQEIYGSVYVMADGRLRIDFPVALRMVPSTIQGGQPSMAMIPFPEMADHTAGPLYIEPLHVVYTFTPFQELISEYNNISNGDNKGSSQIITG